ncbi:MAG: PAS domain-containing protein, partial [Actinomycetota bacterium]|nr:PAS domain-containing protein [Actinomycetota bacterium]
MSESSAVDRLPDAVLELDADRRVVSANAAVTELTGLAREAIVGRPLAEALRPRDTAGHDLCAVGWDRSTRLRSVTRIPEREVRLRGRGSRDVRALVTGRYQRDGDGHVAGAVLVLRDGA